MQGPLPQHSTPAEPVGVPAVARNFLLAGLATAIATQGAQPAIDGWLAARSATGLAIVALSVALIATGTVALWL